MGTRHLKEGEQLLTSQKIENNPQEISASDLNQLYTDKINRRLFSFFPIAHYALIYQSGKKNFDPEKFKTKLDRKTQEFDQKIAAETKERKVEKLEDKKQKKLNKIQLRIDEGNFRMRFGEPLAIYDSAETQLTAERIQNFLYINGYFLAKVNADVSTSKGNKHVQVVYELTPDTPYIIDTIMYRTPDSTVLALLTKYERLSKLKVGHRFSQENFTAERERLDFLFKDYGYFDFSRQYIEFDIDTTWKEKNVAVRVNVLNPERRNYHKPFTLDAVNFITDAGAPSGRNRQRQTERFRNINYSYFDDIYNKKPLSRRVFISEDSLYSRTNTFDTQRQLANMDVFKFVNINYDTSGGQFVANIFTNAMPLYQVSTEIGINVTQGFPGPFINGSIKRRNIFRGLENLEISGRIGFEGVAPATEIGNVYRSTEANANLSLTFPQFLLPISDEAKYKLGRVNPKTRMQTGVAYTDRPEYRRTNFNFSNVFSWQNKNNTFFSLNITDINLIQSNLTDAFRTELQRLDSLGNRLILSFNPSFVSSMIFNVTWNPDQYGTSDKNAVFIRATAESGGTLLPLYQKFLEDNGLQVFRYIRLGLDIRRHQIVKENINLAYRLNSGIGLSYGGSEILPYEKFFFAGGSNSLRAWRPRRTGPGSYTPPQSANLENDGLFDYSFEQPGEVLLEGSVETRFGPFGIFSPAVFIDAGNVWLLNPTSTRQGGEFKFNSFFKEIGVGTGVGLRFDFSFLVLRFDIGLKVYDPARLNLGPEYPGSRSPFVLNKAKFFRPFGFDREPVIYNIGIGYPF